MPPEKRNKFLDVDESEDDGSDGYNSEADEVQKGGGRSAKRRRLADDGEDDTDNEELSDAEYPAKASAGDEGASIEDDGDDNDDDDDKDDRDGHDEKRQKRKARSGGAAADALELPDVTRPLTKKNLVASEEAVKKSGLLYISRVPPYMKPAKLRSLLEPYGKLNRIFLAPEDPQVHARRVKQGGNKKRNYTEGWVEFVRKKDAKNAAGLLNARTIGGPKGSYYRDDIWSLLYLHGFKWHNLTEQIASEAAERTSRMRAEIAKSTRENKEFVQNVEKAKVIDGIQAKAAAKKDPATAAAADSNAGAQAGPQPKAVRQFKQAAVNRRGKEDVKQEARRTLSKLF